MSGVLKSRFAKCWDCKHATNAEGECCWSARLEPVPGWDAEITVSKGYKTYLVHDCPLFVADAQNGGSVRLKRREVKIYE